LCKDFISFHHRAENCQNDRDILKQVSLDLKKLSYYYFDAIAIDTEPVPIPRKSKDQVTD
jgi:hypothetical protein